MRVVLSNARAQRLLTAVRNVASSDKVKFDGMKRLDLARNIERMFDAVGKFERAAGVLQRSIVPGDPVKGLTAAQIEANNTTIAALTALSLEEVELKLIGIEVADLRIDDNATLDPDTIAALAPIIRGFDSMKDDDSD